MSWGESHGPAIGCVVEGVPPNLALCPEDIQYYLDKRKPGGKFVSSRKEEDQVHILSGLFEGKTLGSPISMMIYNQDQNSQDYEAIKDKYRPGHADFTYQEKYGIRDYRGGGRASARETAARVMAGGVARKIIPQQIKIESAIVQIGDLAVNRDNFDIKETINNPFYCPDKIMAEKIEDYLALIKEEGDSVGAILEIYIRNLPVGLGSPIYRKLSAELASAIMSINAVKGVELGSGFAMAGCRGSGVADEMIRVNDKIQFLSNNNGGILGGISTGDDIVIRFIVKPTSSIKKELQTIDLCNKNTTIRVEGRHDPCVGIRAVAVGEAMVACVLADQYLQNNIFKNLKDE